MRDLQMKVRLTEAEKARLEEACKVSGRSMSSEIVTRAMLTFTLEDAAKEGFTRPLGLAKAEIVKIVDERLRRLGAGRLAESEGHEPQE